MRTRNLSFQLEKTLPGVFLLQGWFGGIMAGLVYVAAICFWQSDKFTDAVFMSPYFFILGSFAGVFKSIVMWVPYSLIKIQVRPVTRVVITSIGTGVFAFLLALKFGYGLERPNDTAAWVLTLLVGGLPTAILVGSRVKPWELFTFGSIAVGDSRTGGRVGSKSVLATLATLPLRFLSLIALALWILAGACKVDPNQGIIGPAIVFFIPFIYLLYSAYVTFKSPHRVLLLVSCIALNLPMGLITCYAYIIKPGSYLFTEALPYVCGIGSAFLLAWAIFLVARLTAPTQRLIRETDLQEVLKSGGSHLDHHCLGSRFMEWQERHA
jgi:hypothetical protein